MSAYIVSDNHLWQIVHGINCHPDLKQALANKLKAINIASVNFRYKENTRKTKCKFHKIEPFMSKYDIIRLVQCWSYQSCENGNDVDFLAYGAYLLSHFTRQQIDAAKEHSKIWSI